MVAFSITITQCDANIINQNKLDKFNAFPLLLKGSIKQIRYKWKVSGYYKQKDHETRKQPLIGLQIISFLFKELLGFDFHGTKDF